VTLLDCTGLHPISETRKLSANIVLLRNFLGETVN
jgi:hypothetical protein